MCGCNGVAKWVKNVRGHLRIYAQAGPPRAPAVPPAGSLLIIPLGVLLVGLLVLLRAPDGSNGVLGVLRMGGSVLLSPCAYLWLAY